MSNVTRSIQNPRIASRRFAYSGNMYETVPEVAGKVANSAKYLGGQAARIASAGHEAIMGSKNGVATYREENYRTIKPYEANEPSQGEQAAAANKSPPREPAPPMATAAAIPSSVTDAPNVIYYSKILRYKGQEEPGQNANTGKAEPEKRPVSIDIAVNDDTAIPANRNVALYSNGHAEPERPQTAMISTAGMTANNSGRDTVRTPQKSEATITTGAASTASRTESVENSNGTDIKPHQTMSDVKAYNYNPIATEPESKEADTTKPQKSKQPAYTPFNYSAVFAGNEHKPVSGQNSQVTTKRAQPQIQSTHSLLAIINHASRHQKQS